MVRPRISHDIDEANRLIIIRYLGDPEGASIVDTLLQHWTAMERPWDYDSVFDLRRFDGVLQAQELERLGKGWHQIAKSRDLGHMTAIISSDPLIRARQSVLAQIFPLRTMAVFDTFDEGLEWIKARRTASNALSA